MIIVGLLGLCILFYVWRSNPSRLQEKRFVLPLVSSDSERTSTPTNSGARLQVLGRAARAADFTEAEKEELAKKYTEKFKPAVEKWCKAYEGHVLFRPEEVTLEKFHSRLGPNLYTFMINDTTFTIQDRKGTAMVFYMMARLAAKTLNSLPPSGVMPDLSVPISREEIIRMVKADSGVEFKLNECVIKPTGAACALGGGAFVDMLPTGADPDNGLSSKINFVFGPDGKIVSYQRDPFF